MTLNWRTTHKKAAASGAASAPGLSNFAKQARKALTEDADTRPPSGKKSTTRVYTIPRKPVDKQSNLPASLSLDETALFVASSPNADKFAGCMADGKLSAAVAARAGELGLVGFRTLYDRTGWSIHSIHNMIANGSLPAPVLNVAQNFYFNKSEVDAFFARTGIGIGAK